MENETLRNSGMSVVGLQPAIDRATTQRKHPRNCRSMHHSLNRIPHFVVLLPLRFKFSLMAFFQFRKFHLIIIPVFLLCLSQIFKVRYLFKGFVSCINVVTSSSIFFKREECILCLPAFTSRSKFFLTV